MRICEYCGKEFEDSAKAYCSTKCLSEACHFDLQKKICKKCGKEYETMTDAEYCSFDCAYNFGDLAKMFIP